MNSGFSDQSEFSKFSDHVIKPKIYLYSAAKLSWIERRALTNWEETKDNKKKKLLPSVCKPTLILPQKPQFHALMTNLCVVNKHKVQRVNDTSER